GPEVGSDSLAVGRRRTCTDHGDRAAVEPRAVEAPADPQARRGSRAEVVEPRGPSGLTGPLEMAPEPQEEIEHGPRVGVVDPAPPPGERTLDYLMVKVPDERAKLGEEPCGHRTGTGPCRVSAHREGPNCPVEGVVRPEHRAQRAGHLVARLGQERPRCT